DADQQCGMAWWGAAMSNLHPIWAPPNPNELKTGTEAALKAKAAGAKTDRERAYIDAINIYYADAEKLDHRTRMAMYEKSPHALHMPSHIFTRLGLWDESIASNLAASEKARAYMAQVNPGVTSFEDLHAIDYLEYAYLQRGQNDKARALRDRVNQMTRPET